MSFSEANRKLFPFVKVMETYEALNWGSSTAPTNLRANVNYHNFFIFIFRNLTQQERTTVRGGIKKF